MTTSFFRVRFILFFGILLLSSVVGAEADDPPFAVIELFTSEGCSSCPPADRLLSKMVEQSMQSQSRIFPLAFHVDYWDYLGWKDPFSQNAFSQRQRRYGRSLQSSSVYTPQMIINGREGFGGYRQDLLRDNLREALQNPSEIDLQLTIDSQTSDSVTVTCDVSDINRQANLLVALVERNLETEVLRGENAGKLLQHANVVREFITIPIDDFSHQATFTFPPNLNVDDTSVIAYVQKRESMHIIGANQIHLNSQK